MLRSLNVENFGLMEAVNLEFDRGFMVFTGETGAGKTMLIDTLGVLLGGRAGGDLIRHGEAQARIEGVFEDLDQDSLQKLEEAGYAAEDGRLFLCRELNNSGKNICRLQGRMIPLSLYRSLCEGLADIHGQADQLSLLRGETHRVLLDALGGLQAEVDAVNDAVKVYQAVVRRERELTLSEEERRRREDILRYQIEEIEKIDPLPGEEETLKQEKKRLSNGERITGLITDAYTALYAGSGGRTAAFDLLGQMRKDLQELARLDEAFELADKADGLYFAAEELADLVRDYKDNLEFEPGRQDEIEERLLLLHKLRKYGADTEAVLESRTQMAGELEQISHLQGQLAAIQEEKEKALLVYRDSAAKLSQKRRKTAAYIEESLNAELVDLGLEKSRFEVRFTLNEEPAIGGAEQIGFYFSANPGEPPRPLAKVASGGETSRLMLALKSLLAKVETVGVFIFDEVDSGVGGRTIRQVGEKLAKVARSKQVFCITHAPQVAAFADVHYGIEKEVVGARTKTRVKVLTKQERIEELARMLGGGEGEITRRHACELWLQAERQLKLF